VGSTKLHYGKSHNFTFCFAKYFTIPKGERIQPFRVDYLSLQKTPQRFISAEFLYVFSWYILVPKAHIAWKIYHFA